MARCLLVFCFLITAYCSAQTSEILFYGKIENVKADSGQRKQVTLWPPHGRKEAPVAVLLDHDGSFSDTLQTGDGVYTLFDGNHPTELYFRKGKSYGIRYDAENFREGPVVLEGEDTPVNRYFVEKARHRVFIDRYDKKRSEEDFRQYLGRIRQEQLKRIEQFSLPQEISSLEQENVKWDYLWELYFFTTVREEADERYMPSEATRHELDINYEDEAAYKRNSKYASLVSNHFPVQVEKLGNQFKLKDSSFSIEQNYLRLLHTLVKNEYIRNDLVEQLGRSYLRTVKDKKAFYEDFKTYYTGTNEDFRLQMDSDYLKYSRLKKGTPSPGFSDFVNYRGGTSALHDFRGKFVFIDIWASWCGNCWYQMPYLKQLEEEYKDKNIQFVGISLDKSDREWRETIAKKQISGIQLRATDTRANFFKEYAISGIPRYILINEKGEIVDYNAPRPSERDKLKALFQSVGL